MRTLGVTLASTFCVACVVFARGQTPTAPDGVKAFPEPDFTLRDVELKQQKSGLVLGPMESDGRGGTNGSFVVYGGSSLVQASSLSFSGDGKILAVGSTPGRIDLWDVENKKKLRTLNSGTTVALSHDGHLLAKYGNSIELYDVTSGELSNRISRALPKPNGFITPLRLVPQEPFSMLRQMEKTILFTTCPLESWWRPSLIRKLYNFQQTVHYLSAGITSTSLFGRQRTGAS